MSEINPNSIKIQPSDGTPGDKRTVKKPAPGQGEFRHLLDQQLNSTQESPAESQGTSLPELAGTLKAHQLSRSLDTGLFTRKMEDSLNLLETYAAWLSDPDKSLRQARGILDALIDSTRTLENEFASLATADPERARLLAQLQTTIQVEEIKFNRGDYL